MSLVEKFGQKSMDANHIIHNKNELLAYIEKMKFICKSCEIAHVRLFSSDGWALLNSKMTFNSSETRKTYEYIVQSMFILYSLSAIIGSIERYYPKHMDESKKLWNEDVYIILKIIRNGLAHDLKWSHHSYDKKLPIAHNGLTYTMDLNDTAMDLRYCNHNIVISLIDELIQTLKKNEFT